MTGRLRSWMYAGVGALVGLLLFAFRPAVHALPEYATRTGEPCATCHVNPAGGGPRTVRGTLWIAAGRPDKVPLLPGSDQAGNAAPSAGGADGSALYAQLGCAGCHGATGEGGPGPALNSGEAPPDQLSQVIRHGQGTMPGFKASSLSDAQLAALVQYVQAFGRGDVKAQLPARRPAMQPAVVSCSTGARALAGSCGGN